MSSRDYIKHLVANTSPTFQRVGDEYFDPGSNRLYKTVAVDGTNTSSVEVPVIIPNRPVRFPQSSVNYFQLDGSNTGNTVIFSSQGIDNNISMSFTPKGTGGFDIQSSAVNISNGSTVTAITNTGAGTYTSFPTVAVTAPTTAGGVQATISVATMYFRAVAIQSGGTGYSVNDVLSIVGGTPTGATATATVTSVSAGVITGISVTTGSTYSALPTNPASVTGGTGTGATLNLSWGTVGFTITNAGSGYVEQPTVSFSGGGGSGAAAYATVGSIPTVKSVGSALSFATTGGEQFRVLDSGSNAVNYFAAYGASTGNTPTFGALGSDAAVNLNSIVKGAGAFNWYTNYGGTVAQQFRVSHTASAVNYVQVTGSPTGATASSFANISFTGSDSIVNGTVLTKSNSSTLAFAAGTLGAWNLIVKGATNGLNTGNAIQVSGSVAGASPVISAINGPSGTDTNIDLVLAPKGTGGTIVSNNQANYYNFGGSGTGNTVTMSAQGSDANVAMTFLPKGNGAFNISTANGVNIGSANTGVTYITRTNSTGTYTSVPTVVISPPTTTGGVTATATVSFMQQSGLSPTINAGGTGYTVGDVLTVVGGTPVSTAATMTVTTVSGGVITGVTYTTYQGYTVLPTNAYTTTGGTGTGAQFSSTWYPGAFTITNIGSGYVEQPTVSFTGGGGTGATAYATVGGVTLVRGLGNANPGNIADSIQFRTPAGPAFSIQERGTTTVNYVSVIANGSGNPAVVRSQSLSDANVGLNLGSIGTGSVTFSTNGTSGNQQLVASHTASAVNYVNVTGAVTTISPLISTQGSDANAGLNFSTKGTGNFIFYSNGASNAQFIVLATASAVNRLTVTGSTTGTAPVLGVSGTDTNIDLSLATKGTGAINFQTGSTTTTQVKVTDTATAVNYLQLSGSVTTQSPLILAQGSDTNVGLNIRAKNAGMMIFSKYRDTSVVNQYLFENAGGLSSDANGAAFWRGHHIGAVNYTVSAANKYPRISQFFELQSLTDPTYVQSYYSVGNESTGNIEHFFTNATGAGFTFKATGANSSDKSFRIVPNSTHVNYLQVAGANTANAAILSSQGSDTNVSLALQSKGTGGIDLATGSSGVNISNGGTVTAITGTAIGVSYTSFPSVVISAPTTAGGVQATASVAGMISNNPVTIASGGTGYTVGDTLTVVGGTSISGAATLTVNSVSAGVITAVFNLNFAGYTVLPTNPVSVTGGTGSGATFNLTYSLRSASGFTITNAGSGYVEQPTVSFSGGGGSGAAAYATVGSTPIIRSLGNAGIGSMDFNTPASASNAAPVLRLRDVFASSTNAGYWLMQNNNGYAQLTAQGIPNDIGVAFGSSGAGVIRFNTNGTGETNQMRITHTASAVNYVNVTGGATAGIPIISAQGSDTNVSLGLSGKGSGVVNLGSNGDPYVLQVAGVASGSNYNNLRVQNGIGGTSGPTISSWGIDSNIDINYQSLGTGQHRFSGNGGSNLVFAMNTQATAVNYFVSTATSASIGPLLQVAGTDTNIDFRLRTQGTGAFQFDTGSLNNTQFKVIDNPSSVNYVQVVGSATGASAPAISFVGSDASVGGFINTKGGSGFSIMSYGGVNRQFRVDGQYQAVNYLQVTGGIASAAPFLSSQGSDTNIDLALTPKGTGRVTTTATIVAGLISGGTF